MRKKTIIILLISYLFTACTSENIATSGELTVGAATSETTSVSTEISENLTETVTTRTEAPKTMTSQLETMQILPDIGFDYKAAISKMTMNSEFLEIVNTSEYYSHINFMLLDVTGDGVYEVLLIPQFIKEDYVNADQEMYIFSLSKSKYIGSYWGAFPKKYTFESNLGYFVAFSTRGTLHSDLTVTDTGIIEAEIMHHYFIDVFWDPFHSTEPVYTIKGQEVTEEEYYEFYDAFYNESIFEEYPIFICEKDGFEKMCIEVIEYNYN